MDIICSHDNGEHHAVFLDGQGNSIRVLGHDEQVTNFCVGHPEKVQFADIDGDGKDDMVCDIGGSHWALLSVGDGTFTDFMTWKGSWCAQEGAYVTWIDVTGDGKADMICTDPKTGSYWAYNLSY